MRRLVCFLMVFILCICCSPCALAENQSGQNSSGSFDYDGWVVECTEHIRFHFHPCFTAEQRESFEKTREAAFVAVNSFFESKLPDRIDFYVWDSNASAQKVLNQSLGYSIPGSEIIHSTYHQSRGHELTHVISYWYYPSRKEASLIDEGTAVYFNQNGDAEIEQEKELRDAIKNGEKDPFNLLTLWTDGTSSGKLIKINEDAYTIGGAFVRYLMDNGGKDKFLELMKDQTPTGAQMVYGDSLDKYITEFTTQFSPDVKANTIRWRAVGIANILLIGIVCVLVYRKRLAELMNSLPTHFKKFKQ